MIVCTGCLGLDTTRTPSSTIERALGGAASFFSYSASFFAPVRLVGVVGHDFPEEHWKLLEGKGVDLAGVYKDGKTFFIDWNYSPDGHERTTNVLELNSLATFKPNVPIGWRDSPILYMGPIPAQKQLEMLHQMRKPQLSIMDLLEFYIDTDYNNLSKVVSEVDVLLMNDIEARKYGKCNDLQQAAKKVLDQGPSIVLIKKGANGCDLYSEDFVVSTPAFMVPNAIDPTGAGDSFAGGFVGHLARTSKRDPETLKQALAYGHTMGSFAVEDFGLKKLISLSKQDIEGRCNQYLQKGK